MQWTINPLHKTNPEGPLVGPTCRVGHELADGVTEFCDAQRKSRPAGGTYAAPACLAGREAPEGDDRGTVPLVPSLRCPGCQAVY